MTTTRAVKIGVAWTSIVWTVCYLVLGLIPGAAPTVLPFLFHLDMGPVVNIFSIGNFVGGLVLWNVTVAAGIALAGVLSSYIKS